MNKLNHIEELTFHLYDNIKRFQINVDESLAITLALIYVIYVKQEHFISAIEPKSKNKAKNYDNAIDWITDDINNDFNASFITQKTSEYIINNIRQYDIYYKVQRSIIKSAIEKLVDEKAQLLQTSNKKTASFTQKVITEVANKLVKNGNYIDLAVGTGSLLKDFNGDLYGIDVNPKMVIIARVYLFFCGKYKKLVNRHWEANITQADTIEDYISYKNDKNSIIIFDPPMGDIRQVPEEWYNNIKFNEILKAKKQNIKLPSEVLFLLSFLINSQKEDYFIGLFPESILTRNNKEYSNLKQYLIPNSLLAVIKVPTGHLLLIGKNSENLFEKYPKIPVLNISSELNSKQLEYITDSIANQNHDYEGFYNILLGEPGSVYRQIGIENYNKDFSQMFAYKIYERAEASILNELQIPQIISYEEKTKTNPKEIFDLIKENENKIQAAFNFINNIMGEFDSDDFVEEKEEPQWFDGTKTELESALKYFWIKRFDKYYYDALQMAEFDYKDVYNEQILGYLKCINKFKRLSTGDKENVINIYFKKEDEAQNLEINQFFNILKPENFDNTISDLLKMTDPIVQDVYENHCKYCIADLPEEETLSKSHVPLAVVT